MVLSGEAIHHRLQNGEIFKEGTWHKRCVKEASYALRIAGDGLVINGEFHEPDTKTLDEDAIVIEPGEVAILSTIERLKMPPDLMGKIGIRIDHAMLGLIGFMGIQVDPLFGSDKDDERLFIRVANLGNDPITLRVGEEVFTFELHTVDGIVNTVRKESTWTRVKARLAGRSRLSWTSVARVQYNVDEAQQRVDEAQRRLDVELNRIRNYLQPVVLFGVFLVAVTVLSVAISLILNLRETPEVKVPGWVTEWGWALVIGTLVLATIATAAVGFMMAFRVAYEIYGDWRNGRWDNRDD